MKVVIVTDTWHPQVNGVVTTLSELVRELRELGHEVDVVHPGRFRNWPCPGQPSVRLVLWPGRALQDILRRSRPEAIHLATEGPLGWAARRYCLRRGLAFTTAFHTRFPEILQTTFGLPQFCTYAWLHRFHAASRGVMVPTRGTQDLLASRGFNRLREWTHGVDTRLFRFAVEPGIYEPLGPIARPVSLFVGRLSSEKNVEAFLQLDVPGSKVVCGVGPIGGELRERFPSVHWLGLLSRTELARVYASADVLVFPGSAETFGLVLLEAMACGTPVACHPVDGPREIIGDSGAGAMSDDLLDAWREALRIPRATARLRASTFGWRAATERFLALLVPAMPHSAHEMSRRFHLTEE